MTPQSEVADFEYACAPGERPKPLCVCIRNTEGGPMRKIWLEGTATKASPFDSNATLVGYYAAAEVSCMLELGWTLPTDVIDLFVEFSLLANGRLPICGRDLFGAMAAFGLSGGSTAHKAEMRRLASTGGPFSEEDRRNLLDYCARDVEGAVQLYHKMLPRIDIPRARLRGRYIKAVARMERTGIPIDAPMLARLRLSWPRIQDRLIERIDSSRGIYEGRTFKRERFARYLAERGIPWPRLVSGELELTDEVFREKARLHPNEIGPLRELRHALSQLRLERLAVGSDARNRCMLSPFASRTSRNQPSTSQFIFGSSCWLRSLIKPPVDWALAYIDYEQQEFGIGAALSGDPAMRSAYEGGDPYLEFARQAGAVPPSATKQSHRRERELFKVCALAVQYGMGAEGLAGRLNISTAHAGELLRLHRRIYPRFWNWNDGAVNFALLSGRIHSVFGWEMAVVADPNVRALQNFPLQANGAEMLRLACIFATEAGIHVCAPVHDALLIEAPISEIDAVVAATQGHMGRASELVLGGFALRTDVKIVRHPDRYMDDRGRTFWDTVMALLAELDTDDPPQDSGLSLRTGA